MVAGLCAGRFGLQSTSIGYGALLMALGAIAAVLTTRASSTAR
jgi:hypothetical protein